MMTPSNTPLDKWLSIWVFHEVEAICDEKRLTRVPFSYTGMSPAQRVSAGLPKNRDESIKFIRKHRGDKYDRP